MPAPKNPDETKEVTPVSNEMLQSILDGMEKMSSENEQLRNEMAEMSRRQSSDLEEESVSERKPSNKMDLVVIDGKPIVDMKLEPVMATDHLGNEYTKKMQAKCYVFGKKDPISISYGEISNPKDFLNLPRQSFKLVDQDDSELSGASKILRNQTVADIGQIPEIDRSSGSPVRTGKMVKQLTKRDVRFYTIEVDGEKCELSEDKLYR